MSIPIGAIIYFEWTFFEIITIFISLLNNEAELAGHSGFISIYLFFFMQPLGLGFSINSFFGNLIGAKKK